VVDDDRVMMTEQMTLDGWDKKSRPMKDND